MHNLPTPIRHFEYPRPIQLMPFVRVFLDLLVDLANSHPSKFDQQSMNQAPHVIIASEFLETVIHVPVVLDRLKNSIDNQ